MKLRSGIFALLAFNLIVASTARGQQMQPGNPAQVRIQREVMHELVMLPYYSVFDDISYTVQGGTVTLMGSVTRPTLKSDSENVVKKIEGVDRVDNKINVLPPAPLDDQLRVALFRAIYSFPSLEKYSMGVQNPIRIIVKNGQVDLKGVVDTQSDKNTAGLRANAVPNVFSVTNDLKVVPSSSSK